MKKKEVTCKDSFTIRKLLIPKVQDNHNIFVKHTPSIQCPKSINEKVYLNHSIEITIEDGRIMNLQELEKAIKKLRKYLKKNFIDPN